MKSLIVFLDTSVILSGLASSTGGSAKLLQLGFKKSIKLVVTDKLVQEAAKHLVKLKIHPSKLEAIIKKRQVFLKKTPAQAIIKKFSLVTSDPNDAHVLAGAVVCSAHALVSLDKKHIITPKVKRSLKPIKILTPKQFWHWLGKNPLLPN